MRLTAWVFVSPRTPRVWPELAGRSKRVLTRSSTVSPCIAIPACSTKWLNDGTVLVPTLTTFHDLAERFVDDFPEVLVEQAKRQLEEAYHTVSAAKAAGVTIAVGFDSGPPGTSAQEMIRLHDAGLSTNEVIAAATSGGAAALGRSELGSINGGSLADIVVVEGNPDEDLSLLLDPGLITTVFKDGVAAF